MSNGCAIAVVGLGVAFAAPVDSIVLVVAAAIAVAGALWSFADLGRKVLADIEAMERLRAIDGAKQTLAALVP